MQYYKELLLKNGKSCIIRTADGSDAAGVLRCFLKTHAETDNMLTYPEERSFTEADERDFLDTRAARDNSAELCAVVDGEIVGTAGFDPVGTQLKLRHRATFGIGVLRDSWGLGIGRALTESCIALAKQAGYRQLELEVLAQNLAAISLYQSVGFLEYGRNPCGFRTRDGEDQTLVLMRLPLV